MDNYEKQVYTGRKLFLKYDQDKLIEKYGLKHDEEYLYLKYIGTEYRIDRGNGAIEYVADDEWTDCREYTIVMTIYDFLCCFSSGMGMKNSCQRFYCCGIRYRYHIFILRQPIIFREIFWRLYCRPSAEYIAAGHLEGGTQYLKAEHKRGKEPDELVTARIEVGDQMELLF